MANSVYLDNTELKRLEVQRQLLIEYEQPIYNEIINKRTGLTLLDIGCNDGSKTKTRFSENNFDKIIGLDCLDEKLIKNLEMKSLSFFHVMLQNQILLIN